ncbi:hypothetical protein BDR06DRAFT_982431 [Suillus hirtellus]|nr:hypothetical protein BDR06DRAFT_982431 [Suillus hirtellus]
MCAEVQGSGWVLETWIGHLKSTFTTITPTIGPICDEQFDKNIQPVILASCADTTTLHGIMLEETAIDNRKYNKIAGLCWKHSHLIDPILCTYNSAVNVAQKIHNELTVIGVTCFAASTCKTENTDDMQGVLSHAIGHWKATGAAVQVRPIWSVATDGHQLFVKNPLILTNMPRLNMLMGDDEITLDFDFKHIFKHKFFFDST